MATVLILTAGLASPVLMGQPLADFPFNEGTGKSTTDRVTEHAGTLGTEPPAEGRIESLAESPSGRAGDRSVLFQRAEHLVVTDVGAAIKNAVYPGAFTVETWFRTDLTEMPSVLGGFGSPGNGWSFGVYGSGMLTFTQAGVADVQSDLAVPVFGEWTHVACVYEPQAEGGALITFYVDGWPSQLQATGSMIEPVGDVLRLGAWLNGGFGPTGALDRFRLHRGALTAEQLDSEAANPKAPLADTVVAYALDGTAAPYPNGAGTPLDAVASFSLVADDPTWVTSTPSGLAGDTALSFEVGDVVTVADPEGLYQAENSDLTLEAWVRPGALSATGVILSYGPPGGYLLALRADRAVQFTALGVADIVSSMSVPGDGAWHHVAAVHKQGQQVEFYLNGELKDTRPYTGGIRLSETPTLVLGRFPDGALGYLGSLDRVKIHRGVVSANELDWRPVPGVDPEAPALDIASAVLISWPSVPPGYVLQVTDSLAEPVQWTDAGVTPVLAGERFQVYLPAEARNRYYRLVKP